VVFLRKTAIFIFYFILGFCLILSFEKANQIIGLQQLKSPLPSSPFSLNVAPGKSLRGTIANLSGDVLWQSRIATTPAAIKKPQQIQQGEDLVTKGNGQANIVFSSVANLLIYPKTEVNFIQTLPENILIEQKSGDANYKALKDNLLNIRSNSLLAKINQGEIMFSVNENQPQITIDVKSGQITVAYNDINYLTQVMNISSGNRLIFNTNSKRISLAAIQ